MLWWTWECRYLFKILISIPLGVYLEVELLDHVVVLFLMFCETSVLFSKVAALGNSLEVQWLRLWAFTAEGTGLTLRNWDPPSLTVWQKKWLNQFLHSSTVYKGSLFSIYLPTVISFLNDNHSDRCEIISNCCFD